MAARFVERNMSLPPPVHVLVVDDEPLIRWSLTETLSAQGDAVIEAGTGDAAIRAMTESTTPIDVVLLDYRLPDRHDLGLLANLRRISPNSRVIMMSACLEPEVASEALSLGASRVIGKPVDMRDVQALVHDVAGSPQHRDPTPAGDSEPGST
jgi:DNA-binding NtrC family response regulator